MLSFLLRINKLSATIMTGGGTTSAFNSIED